MSDRVLRVRDVIARLGVSRRHVYRLIAAGALAATKHHRDWRIAEHDVDAVVAQRSARSERHTYGLSKPETHALILWAIARGDAARAARLTRVLAHRCHVEQQQRAQRRRPQPQPMRAARV